MVVAYWIIAGLLAALYLFAGLTKIVQPKDKLYSMGMKYVEDFSAQTVRTIGALEVLGAIGLIVPRLVDIAPVLSPVAAVGLAVLQGLAIRVHLRRGEKPIPNVVLLVLALAAAAIAFATL